VDAIAKRDANGYTFEAEAKDEALRVRVTETETSAATVISVPAELLGSPVYANVRKAYSRVTDAVGGLPPFAVRLGKRAETAETFDELRATSLELAKQGLQITRFKGLGEMNEDELWKTTMDPARRLLIRADVEDASAADLWFSRLMGDQVEPRREFIEANAREVRFLDV
jgi:DNA gyrase subunit B